MVEFTMIAESSPKFEGTLLQNAAKGAGWELEAEKKCPLEKCPPIKSARRVSPGKMQQAADAWKHPLLDYEYRVGDELGRGSSGRVYHAFNCKLGNFVAVKEIPISETDSKTVESFESEVELLNNLKHPSIVRIFESIRTNDHLYIVMEWIENGSLAATAKRFGSLSEPILSGYIQQVLSGLEWLHSHGVCHRDIKGANLLVTKGGRIKLADFGAAARRSDPKVVGTPFWMAPEIIKMAEFSTASDIWSLACTIVELCCGQPPYADLRAENAIFRIVNDKQPPMPSTISPELNSLLLDCFTQDPLDRPNATQLQDYSWVKQEPCVPSKIVSCSKGVTWADRDGSPMETLTPNVTSTNAVSSLNVATGDEYIINLNTLERTAMDRSHIDRCVSSTMYDGTESAAHNLRTMEGTAICGHLWARTSNWTFYVRRLFQLDALNLSCSTSAGLNAGSENVRHISLTTLIEIRIVSKVKLEFEIKSTNHWYRLRAPSVESFAAWVTTISAMWVSAQRPKFRQFR